VLPNPVDGTNVPECHIVSIFIVRMWCVRLDMALCS